MNNVSNSSLWRFKSRSADSTSQLSSLSGQTGCTCTRAAEQRLQQHTPLCDVDEEAALAGQLRAATHSSVLEPVLERLWECWLGERGRVAQDYLDSGTDLMSSGQLSSAARIFQSAREQYPGWAEATNKLATVYYLQGKLRESAVLCREVLGEKPHHFGAASGLVQVLVGLDELDEALSPNPALTASVKRVVDEHALTEIPQHSNAVRI